MFFFVCSSWTIFLFEKCSWDVKSMFLFLFCKNAFGVRKRRIVGYKRSSLTIYAYIVQLTWVYRQRHRLPSDCRSPGCLFIQCTACSTPKLISLLCRSVFCINSRQCASVSQRQIYVIRTITENLNKLIFQKYLKIGLKFWVNRLAFGACEESNFLHIKVNKSSRIFRSNWMDTMLQYYAHITFNPW